MLIVHSLLIWFNEKYIRWISQVSTHMLYIYHNFTNKLLQPEWCLHWSILITDSQTHLFLFWLHFKVTFWYYVSSLSGLSMALANLVCYKCYKQFTYYILIQWNISILIFRVLNFLLFACCFVLFCFVWCLFTFLGLLGFLNSFLLLVF